MAPQLGGWASNGPYRSGPPCSPATPPPCDLEAGQPTLCCKNCDARAGCRCPQGMMATAVKHSAPAQIAGLQPRGSPRAGRMATQFAATGGLYRHRSYLDLLSLKNCFTGSWLLPPGYDCHGGQKLGPCSDRRPAASGKPTGWQDGTSVCRNRWFVSPHIVS